MFIPMTERNGVVNEDIRGVLDATRDVAEGAIAANAARIDRERSFPAENLQALAGAGALGLTVPEASGGLGGGLGAIAEACETVGAACASTGMVFLMHEVTAATITGGGGPFADDVLPRLAAGGAIGTLAFSERGTGAHFYDPGITVERTDGSVLISGRKSFVTSGGHADVYLVLVQSGREEGGIDCYAVRRDDPGVRFEDRWEGLGMAGNSSVALELDGVSLDETRRIGDAGAGAALVFGVVAPTFLIGLAAVNVGIAAAAARAATGHAVERRYGNGTSLAEVQAIQHLIAAMDMTVRQARLLVRDAAALGDGGDASALVAIMEAKVAATEAAISVTQQALEVCGGQGYTPALPIERHLRDGRAGSVMAPTNGVLRSWIGKALAGLPVP
jgi:isovaleryl-CoA dehydrogenase